MSLSTDEHARLINDVMATSDAELRKMIEELYRERDAASSTLYRAQNTWAVSDPRRVQKKRAQRIAELRDALVTAQQRLLVATTEFIARNVAYPYSEQWPLRDTDALGDEPMRPTKGLR